MWGGACEIAPALIAHRAETSYWGCGWSLALCGLLFAHGQATVTRPVVLVVSWLHKIFDGQPQMPDDKAA